MSPNIKYNIDLDSTMHDCVNVDPEIYVKMYLKLNMYKLYW